MTRISGIFKALTSTFSVELPGIEPEPLPGKMHSELRFRYISFRLSPARYLRFRFRVLTASRAATHFPQLPFHSLASCDCTVDARPQRLLFIAPMAVFVASCRVGQPSTELGSRRSVGTPLMYVA